MKRQFKRTVSSKESVEESLGPSQVQKKDIKKLSGQQGEENVRQEKLLEDIQAEVDLFIGAYLKQESLEKDKKDEYDQICQTMDEMQKEMGKRFVNTGAFESMEQYAEQLDQLGELTK